MNDPSVVGGTQSIRNRDGHFEQFLNCQAATCHALLEGLAFQPFHRDERCAFGLADVIDSADVGMVQCRCGPCFPLKSCERAAVMSQFLCKELESHETLQPGVLGFVDDTHAPLA